MRRGDSWTGVLVVCLVAMAFIFGGYLVFAYLYDITQAMGM